MDKVWHEYSVSSAGQQYKARVEEPDIDEVIKVITSMLYAVGYSMETISCGMQEWLFQYDSKRFPSH